MSDIDFKAGSSKTLRQSCWKTSLWRITLNETYQQGRVQIELTKSILIALSFQNFFSFCYFSWNFFAVLKQFSTVAFAKEESFDAYCIFMLKLFLLQIRQKRSKTDHSTILHFVVIRSAALLVCKENCSKYNHAFQF